MGRLLKGRGSQKTCLVKLLELSSFETFESYSILQGSHSANDRDRATHKKGPSKLGAALQAFNSLKGFFILPDGFEPGWNDFCVNYAIAFTLNLSM